MNLILAIDAIPSAFTDDSGIVQIIAILLLSVIRFVSAVAAAEPSEFPLMLLQLMLVVDICLLLDPSAATGAFIYQILCYHWLY